MSNAPPSHGICLHSMQNYMPPAARSSMPHLSPLLPRSLAHTRPPSPRHPQCRSHPAPSGSAVQVGWTTSHAGIIGNELADAAAKLAAEGNHPDGLNFHWPYSYLRSQIRDRLLQEWQVWHKPRDDPPPLHEAISRRRFPSPRSYPPVSDETSCLLPPPIQGSAYGVKRKSRPLSMLYSAAPLVNMPGGTFSRP